MVPAVEQHIFSLLCGQWTTQTTLVFFVACVIMIHCIFIKASNRQIFVKLVESYCHDSGVAQWWIRLHVCVIQDKSPHSSDL